MAGAAASSSSLSEKLVASLAAMLLPGAQARGTTLRSLLASRLREVAHELEASGTSAAASVAEAAQSGGPSSPDAAAPAPKAAAAAAAAGGSPAAPQAQGNKRRKAQREFDMSRFPQRTVALEIFYAGWKYAGFTTQGEGPGCADTVELHLWRALKKTRLVAPEATWSDAGYSRCGRTDAGVSAMRQIVALRVRSNLGTIAPYQPRAAAAAPAAAAAASADVEMAPADDPQAPPAAAAAPAAGAAAQQKMEREEIDYVAVLNRHLPEDIRVLRWSDVPGPDFSARFSCQWREYKYFFFNDGLDIERMREAAQHLVGEHDFRNFCKMDVVNVHSYRRRVMWTVFQPEGGQAAAAAGASGEADDVPLWSFNIRGKAFLWHQVRCMMSVLFLVGRGLESPDVVSRLLDLQATPRKPLYTMAPDEPLVLYTCGYQSDLPLACTESSRRMTAAALKEQARRHMIRAKTMYLAQRHMEGEGAPVPLEDASAAGGEKYVPLLKRHTEKTYEERRADKERAGKVLSAPRPPGAGAGGAAAAGAAKPAGSDGEDEGGE